MRNRSIRFCIILIITSLLAYGGTIGWQILIGERSTRSVNSLLSELGLPSDWDQKVLFRDYWRDWLKYTDGFDIVLMRCPAGQPPDSTGWRTDTAISDNLIIENHELSNIPVILGADFGHVFPMITFPVGGTGKITANTDGVEIQIITH